LRNQRDHLVQFGRIISPGHEGQLAQEQIVVGEIAKECREVVRYIEPELRQRCPNAPIDRQAGPVIVAEVEGARRRRPERSQLLKRRLGNVAAGEDGDDRARLRRIVQGQKRLPVFDSQQRPALREIERGQARPLASAKRASHRT